jgi:hypothetical protein
MIISIDEIEHIFDVIFIGERSENRIEFVFILAGNDFERGKLVICQKKISIFPKLFLLHIERGQMRLDQLIFQHQRFQFRACERPFDIGNAASQHLGSFVGIFHGIGEILSHASPKIYRLSDVDNLIKIVVKFVYSRLLGNSFDNIFQVFSFHFQFILHQKVSPQQSMVSIKQELITSRSVAESLSELLRRNTYKDAVPIGIPTEDRQNEK